jgi:hypothetical protein
MINIVLCIDQKECRSTTHKACPLRHTHKEMTYVLIMMFSLSLPLSPIQSIALPLKAYEYYIHAYKPLSYHVKNDQDTTLGIYGL